MHLKNCIYQPSVLSPNPVTEIPSLPYFYIWELIGGIYETPTMLEALLKDKWKDFYVRHASQLFSPPVPFGGKIFFFKRNFQNIT